MKVHFLSFPTVSCVDYQPIPFDKDHPRAIPFPDGCFGDNPYILIKNNGKKVTFIIMQEHSTINGYYGIYPDEIIQFAKVLLEEKNKGSLANKHTSNTITDLERVLSDLFSRAVDKHIRGVQGTYNP